MDLSRRDFLRGTAGAALVAGLFPNIVPGSVLGANGVVSPGNRVVVGVIGCGPQGLGDMGNFLKCDGCQVVAVCDVKEEQAEKARGMVNERYGNQGCRVYQDFREMVARKDIDACLIATPDHWHVLAALAAVNSGKDVYVEKPLGLSLAEDRALRAAVHRKKRVFQFGTQQRSERTFRLACELVRNGGIGKLRHINTWAPGSAPGGSREIVPVPQGCEYRDVVGTRAVQTAYQGPLLGRRPQKNLVVRFGFCAGFYCGLGDTPDGHSGLGRGRFDERSLYSPGTGEFPLG